MRKAFLFGLVALFFSATFSFAQTPTATGFSNGNNSHGDPNWIEVTPTTPLPVTGSITANLGAFAPSGNYATLAVSNSSSNVALPGGTPTSIVVYNTGSVNAFVKLGTTNSVVATTTEDVVSPGCFNSFSIGSNAYLAAITSTSTTNLIISGGSGLASSGCAPTVSISSNASVNVNQWAGSALGAPSNYGTSPGAVTVPGVNAFVTNSPSITNITGTVSLPTGAATSANQTSQITQETAINTLLGTLGTAAGCSAGSSSTAISCMYQAHIDATASLPGGSATIGNVNDLFNIGNLGTQPHMCGSFVKVHVTTNTDTQILAASGSTTIYVCDYKFSLTGVGNFFLEKATTGTCATLTAIDIPWAGLASVPTLKTDANPFYQGINTGASAQLCVNTTNLSSTALDLGVHYDQY